MRQNSIRYVILGAIILFSLLGGLIAAYTTTNGPWGFTDPVAYISMARSLDHGQGFAYYEGDGQLSLATIHPPFYSLVLSAIGLFGANLVAASRWLNIFAFAASIFIAGWIFYRYSPVPALGVLASALMAAFPYMVTFFSSAYSEPLFILSILASGWAVLAYLENERTSRLVLAALAASTIPGTRYAGLAILAAAALTILLLASGTLRPRLKKTFWFSLLAVLPIAVWLVWVYFASDHTVGGRIPDLQLASLLAHFQTFRGVFIDTVWEWFPFQSHQTLLRYWLRFVLLGLMTLIILGLSILAIRSARKNWFGHTAELGMRLFTFFGLSSFLFVVILVLTYLFTHPTIDIDNRMLLPLYVCGTMTVYAAFSLWQTAWFHGRWRFLGALPWLIAVLCVAWYIPQTREKVQFYRPGYGLTAYRWDHSSLIQAVRNLPADQPVIANDWELTLLWTGRPIHGLWTSRISDPPLQETPYGTNPDDPYQVLFCTQGAALVIYEDFPQQVKDQFGEAASDKAANLFTGLTVSGRYKGGTIYLCP
jgi:hypothetical protein